MKNDLIESPAVTVEENKFTLHNYINTDGKMVLNKHEAILLYAELRKFLNNQFGNDDTSFGTNVSVFKLS